MSKRPDYEQLRRKMRGDWDERACENAMYYVSTTGEDWTEEEFFRSGQKTIEEQIANDMTNICQGKDPGDMRVLEIGCGLGRLTLALAGLFGEVHAVDVSGEMISRARQYLRATPNVHLYRNSGVDLTIVPKLEFDFAFSMIVFQHIPSKEVIENYLREVNRLLRPGALFKFQVQGGDLETSLPDDTWVGATFSETEARELALLTNFEPRYLIDAGTQYFWLWFFKNST